MVSPLIPAVFFALDGHGVLALDGPDAAVFAQSQFANDVLALPAGQWQWNAWLTPKGRVLAVFDIGHEVRCDEARLGQMLSNLLINALVHGSADSTIQVMAVTTDDTLRINVANRGVIPADEVARIFEPFDRPADRRLAPGLGLGLYIASQIAVAHGGELRVFSSEAADTLFEFTLPLGVANETGQVR